MAQYDKAKAEQFKEQGNTCFSEKHYIPAVSFYDQAIEVCSRFIKIPFFLVHSPKVCPPTESAFLAILYGNRAFANLKMENFGLTITDAEKGDCLYIFFTFELTV